MLNAENLGALLFQVRAKKGAYSHDHHLSLLWTSALQLEGKIRLINRYKYCEGSHKNHYQIT